jgi:hypothetical protein
MLVVGQQRSEYFSQDFTLLLTFIVSAAKQLLAGNM